MLLVITPSAKALGSVQAIQQITSEETHVAATSSQALAWLRAQEYVALLSIKHSWKPSRSRVRWCWNISGQPFRSMCTSPSTVWTGLRASCAPPYSQQEASLAGPAGGATSSAKRTQGHDYSTAALLRDGTASSRSSERSQEQEAQRPRTCPGDTPQARRSSLILWSRVCPLRLPGCTTENV